MCRFYVAAVWNGFKPIALLWYISNEKEKKFDLISVKSEVSGTACHSKQSYVEIGKHALGIAPPSDASSTDLLP